MIRREARKLERPEREGTGMATGSEAGTQLEGRQTELNRQQKKPREARDWKLELYLQMDAV